MSFIKNTSLALFLTLAFAFVVILLFPRVPASALANEVAPLPSRFETVINQKMVFSQGTKEKTLFENVTLGLTSEKIDDKSLRIYCDFVRAEIFDEGHHLLALFATDAHTASSPLLAHYASLAGESVDLTLTKSGCFSSNSTSPLAAFVETPLLLFPARSTPIHKGTQWTTLSEVSANSPRITETKWSCISNKNGQLTLTFTSAISTNPLGQKQQLNDLTMSPNTEGVEAGTITLDSATREILHGKINGKQTKQILSPEGPITLTITSETTLKKL